MPNTDAGLSVYCIVWCHRWRPENTLLASRHALAAKGMLSTPTSTPTSWCTFRNRVLTSRLS